MKYRKRTYYTEEQKAMMWDRWQKGETLGSIARLVALDPHVVIVHLDAYL
ncbi:MAG: hypothetical protein GY820_31395 [Gammaproteobacteria bacterium]|nr:hypothetical protein [Gammaproteobacteria bacterium]